MTVVLPNLVVPSPSPPQTLGPDRTVDYASGTREDVTVDIDSDQLLRDVQRAALPGHAPQSHQLRTASTRAVGSAPALPRKIVQLLREEFAGFHLRLLVAQAILAPLPIRVGGRVRALILRLIGFQIDRGTIFAGMPTMTGERNIYKNLVIGSCCWINSGCLFDLGAEIRIGSHVSIGHDVLVLTFTHEIGTSRHRAATLIAKPVNIGSGVWVGSRSTILPGVTIGSGAIVAAGSVVLDDVVPNTIVAGVPARAVKHCSDVLPPLSR
jgi:maltose O-acetyltransferase